MKRIFIAAAIALCFAPISAQANERMGGVAAGALAGAIVLGPVGAIVGAAVGYGAGSVIAHRNAAVEPTPAPANPRREAARQPIAEPANPKPVPLPRARPSAGSEARAEFKPATTARGEPPPVSPRPSHDEAARAVPH